MRVIPAGSRRRNSPSGFFGSSDGGQSQSFQQKLLSLAHASSNVPFDHEVLDRQQDPPFANRRQDFGREGVGGITILADGPDSS